MCFLGAPKNRGPYAAAYLAYALRRHWINDWYFLQAYNILAKPGSHTLIPCGDNSKMNNTTIGSILEPIADIAEACNKVCTFFL